MQYQIFLFIKMSRIFAHVLYLLNIDLLTMINFSFIVTNYLYEFQNSTSKIERRR